LRRAKFTDNTYLTPQTSSGQNNYPRGPSTQNTASLGGGGYGRGGPATGDPAIDMQNELNGTPTPVRRNNRSEYTQQIQGGGQDEGTMGKGNNTSGASKAPGGLQSRAQVQDGVNPDSIVIPTHKNKGGVRQDFGGMDEDPYGNKVGGGGEDGNLQNAEDIKPVDMQRAQPLIPELTEFIVKGIFSKNWSIREKAASVLQQEIMKGSKSDK
jgi:hypothetical protein